MKLKNLLLLVLLPISVFAEVNFTNWTTAGIDFHTGHSNLVGVTSNAAHIVLNDTYNKNQAQAGLYQIDLEPPYTVHMVGSKFNILSGNAQTSLAYDRTGVTYVAYDSGNNIRILKLNGLLQWETFANYPFANSQNTLKDFKLIISKETNMLYIAFSHVATIEEEQHHRNPGLAVTNGTSQLYVDVVGRSIHENTKWNNLASLEMGSNLALSHFNITLDSDKNNNDKFTIACVNEKHMAVIYSSLSGWKDITSGVGEALFKVKDGIDRVNLAIMSNGEPMLSFLGNTNHIEPLRLSNNSWGLHRHPTEYATNISSPHWFFNGKANINIYSYITSDANGYYRYATQIYDLSTNKWIDARPNPTALSFYNKDLGEVSYDEDNNKLFYLADETDDGGNKRIIIQWLGITK